MNGQEHPRARDRDGDRDGDAREDRRTVGERFRPITKARAANVAAAAVEWPLGNDGVPNRPRGPMSGRTRSTAILIRSTSELGRRRRA